MSFLYYSKTYQFPRNCDTRPPYTCMSVRGQPRQRACCPLTDMHKTVCLSDMHEASPYDFWALARIAAG